MREDDRIAHYHAERRLQSRSNPEKPNELAYHEDRGDGTPLCGLVNESWEGRPMIFAHASPGSVTCGSCARIAGRRGEAGEVGENGEELEEGGLDPALGSEIPQFHQIYRELLEILDEHREMTVPDLARAAGERLDLSEDVMQRRLPSGRPVVQNRVHWAALSLSKAELAELVGPSTYRILDAGHRLLHTEGKLDRDLLLRTRPSYAQWFEDMGISEASEDSPVAGQSVWMVRAGRGGVMASDFLRVSAAVVGWGQTGTIDGLSREDIVARVREAFPEYKARQRGQSANTLFHLLQTMRDGDLVITPEPSSRTLLLGRIDGPYRYLEESITADHQHARPVDWFGRASRDELSYGAKNSLGTLLTLTRPSFAPELLRLAERHSGGPAPEPLARGGRGSAPAEPQWAHVTVPPDARVTARAVFADFPTFSQPLMHLLEQLHSGELGLPDFQRSFVWPPEATRELLVSIIRGFPAGNLLFLRGGSKTFKTRAAEEAPALQHEPSYLILDGQQRLTSLYQALFGLGSCRFYLDVGSLLAGGEIEESVRYFSLERLGGLDRIEAQAAALMLPLSRVRAGETYRWIDEVVGTRDDDGPGRLRSLLYDIEQAYVAPFGRYAFPVTQLPDTTELDAVCSIFETLNRTGRPLTTFELISARAFASGLSLRDFWQEALERHPILEDFEIDPVYLLQVIALRQGAQCKRSVILRLPADVIEREWQPTVQNMASALRMLRSHCGVLVSKWLPYRPMLIPMAGAWQDIDRTAGPAESVMRAKLIRWFWCASFAGEYESSSATLAERDSPALRAWLAGGEAPPVAEHFTWDPERWRAVTTRQQGLYRGTMALILSQAPRDLHSGEPLTPELIAERKIDDHHIFPRAYLREIGRGNEIDSVLNHVLIDRDTNGRIGKRPPSQYLAEIRTVIGEGINAVLASHRLPHEPESPLERDDFDAFLTWRLHNLHESLLTRTGTATMPVEEVPSHLKSLDARVEQIELALRRLLSAALDDAPQLLPEPVKQKIRERYETDERRLPGKPSLSQLDLAHQLQYADLRELQSTIVSKPLWPRFAGTFANKVNLEQRFDQLANLRNAIRHNRSVDLTTRSDGEAAIHWFQTALSQASS